MAESGGRDDMCAHMKLLACMRAHSQLWEKDYMKRTTDSRFLEHQFENLERSNESLTRLSLLCASLNKMWLVIARSRKCLY